MKEKIKGIKSKILKIDNLIVGIFILIAVSVFAFDAIISANDELWNFSNVYKMSYGETIYEACNVIVTPLFFYIGQIIFKILGANYFSFRIYNLLLYSILYFLLYRLFKKLTLSKLKAFTYLILIYFFTCTCILIGANYNILAFIFVIVEILYNLDTKEKKSEPLMQGLIMFLVFMSKQNIGLLYILGIIIISILNKTNIKNIFKQIAVFILFIGLYLLGLFFNGNLYNFINYTVLGLLEFGNKNTLVDSYIIIFIAEIALLVGIIIYCKKHRENVPVDIRKRIIILNSFSIMMLFNAYPIFNKAHIILSSIFSFVAIVYFIDSALFKELNNKYINRTMVALDFISMIIILILGLILNTSYIKNIRNNNFEPYFGGIMINQNEVQNVANYIMKQKEKNIEVIIISYKASLYNNILKINNGGFDLPFYGNLGVEGIEGLINKLDMMKNTNVLITKDEIKYQESQELRDYVINNFEKIGEIEEFYIYKVGY